MNEDYFKTIFIVKDGVIQFPDSFAILTACNPMDRELSDKENKLRNREMRSLLAEEELDYSELVGSSPDGSHQEPSFAVSCKLEDAIDWANRFEQRAIFWIEENQLQIIASENGDRFQLGPFRERIRRNPNSDEP